MRIVLLRAINVGGGGKLPMAELRELVTGMGATDVATYIASGNLICTPPGDPSNPEEFDRALEQAIEKRFGFFRDVISRSHDEVVAALTAHPYEVTDPRFSYVTFLAAEPTAEAIEKARTFATGDDKWTIIGQDMHIRYANGAGAPQMKDASIGRALGVPGTARNLNTVRKLIDLTT